MPSLDLDLMFDCCACQGKVELTVRCQGRGLAAGPRTVAAVQLRCPNCGGANEVCFHPTGRIVAVRPMDVRFWIPLPSVN